MAAILSRGRWVKGAGGIYDNIGTADIPMPHGAKASAVMWM